jgi:hypothetical protein
MVVFEGEEGIDQGGVAKEFFQLIVRPLCFLRYHVSALALCAERIGVLALC